VRHPGPSNEAIGVSMLTIVHRYKHYLGAFAFFIIFFTIFFFPVIVRGHILGPGDGLVFYYPAFGAAFHFGPSSYLPAFRLLSILNFSPGIRCGWSPETSTLS
jgi:hypothetical protein